MTKIDELNLKLSKHDSQREAILDEIANQTDKDEISVFELVGKCFQKDDNQYFFYKILKLHHIFGDGISIKALVCNGDCIKIDEMHHYVSDMVEIEPIDFDISILQLSTKLLNSQ